jgi:uncharacterized protein (TIGR00299 family) protein
MTVAFIECVAGASGDMFLGAWLDLGVPEDTWRQQLAGLSVHEYEIVVERVKPSGIAATKVNVLTAHSHHHRHLPDIERIIDASDLPLIVKEKSKEAFHHLAVAEAAVHGTVPEKIHFHEVGAVDAIVDIVGSMIAWHLLGQPTCVVTPIEVGGGTVKCAHGVMPVPAPATTRLLAGFPTYSSGLWGETTTPTGAAILRTLAQPYSKRPFIGKEVGYGAGTKELPVANLLRIQLGDWAPATMPVSAGAEQSAAGLPNPVSAVVIEANVDDMSPEFAGYIIEKLLAQGAMDATWTPMVMKKGRPAIQLQVLCAREKLPALQEEIFRQSSSIGLRYYDVEKLELPRETMEVQTNYGPVAVKAAKLGGATVNVAPEYETCKKLAEEQGVSFKQVYQSALAQAVADDIHR